MESFLDCIPSKDLKEFLNKHPISLTILQKATIVSEFGSKRQKIKRLRQLAETTENDSERILLSTAIEEIAKTGYPGETTNRIYKSLFPHEGFPLYPFLEVCNLPVLFHKNDLVTFRKHHYFVADYPCITDNDDFTDECYLCYDLSARIESEEDMFSAHDQIHVCEAETASDKDLSKKEQRTLVKVKRILQNTSD
jgi:hypothetical protein